VNASQRDEGITTPETSQPSLPQGSVPTVKPPDVPTNCNKTTTGYVTDLAITDIYPGNLPKGQFWVRITNNGPVSCSNVNFNFLGCSVDSTPKSDVWVIPPAGDVSSATINTDPNIEIIPGYVFPSGLQKVSTTLNIKPGETQEIPTGIGFDMDLSIYKVTCNFTAESGYNDLNNSNNFYLENIPQLQ
jgi:hypothetical protein